MVWRVKADLVKVSTGRIQDIVWSHLLLVIENHYGVKVTPEASPCCIKIVIDSEWSGLEQTLVANIISNSGLV